MKLRLVAYGIAKEIIKAKSLEVDYPVNDLGGFKERLCQEYPEFLKLNSIAFAIDETYQTNDFELSEEDEIVIIPPVAGG